MHTPRTRLLPLLSVVTTFAFAACGGDDDKATVDTADTGTLDTGTPDTGTPDTETPDTETPDSVLVDTALTDTTELDTTTTDVAEDTSRCSYLEDPRVLECGGLLNSVLYWSDWGDATCPTYYTHGDDRYETLATLASAMNCNAACEYRATIAVDLIGCVGGHRTGYERYEADGEGCLDAVYGTPVGLVRDLCDWEEIACQPQCNDACQESVVGTVDQAQLSGAGGTGYGTASGALGQTFTVGADGILAGVEVRIGRCTSKEAAQLVVLDVEGNELAYAELAYGGIPEACTNAASLSEGAPGPGYFAIASACVPVSVGDVLEFRVSTAGAPEGSCTESRACSAAYGGRDCSRDADCDPYIGLGEDVTAPYSGGTLTFAGGPIPSIDLAFKVFVESE